MGKYNRIPPLISYNNFGHSFWMALFWFAVKSIFQKCGDEKAHKEKTA